MRCCSRDHGCDYNKEEIMDLRRFLPSDAPYRFVPWLIGASLTLVLLLFLSTLPFTGGTEAQTPPTPTTLPAGGLRVVKSSSVNPLVGALRGSTVTFTIVINTGSNLTNITAEDIFAGG